MSWMEDMNTAAENDGSFEPLAEGTYDVRLAEVNSEINNEDGIVTTSLEFHLENSKRRVWENVKHSDNVLWKAGLLFNGMDIKGEVNGWHEWANAMAEQINRSFRITTKNREYNDKTYTGVTSIEAVGEAVPF